MLVGAIGEDRGGGSRVSTEEVCESHTQTASVVWTIQVSGCVPVGAMGESLIALGEVWVEGRCIRT